MKQTDVKVPPILLEGDQPPGAPTGDQPEKFVLGPGSQAAPCGSTPAGLSESYGTGRLMLTARDPNCLYAHWDLSPSQQRGFTNQSATGILQLRIHRGDVSSPPIKEVPVPAESKHSFVEVPNAGGRFVAELGFPGADGAWQRIALSEPALTPAATTDRQEPVRFATLEFSSNSQSSGQEIVANGPSVPESVAAVPLLLKERQFPLPPPLPRRPAPEQILPELASISTEPTPVLQPGVSGTDFPSSTMPPLSSVPLPPGQWTPAQERALAELIGWTFPRQQSVSSAEIAELLRGESQIFRQLPQTEVESMEALIPQLPSSAAPLLSPERGGFWFNVNAELIIYGATEPDARVVLAGKAVDLRPDGTFTCRFALPDGSYKLAAVATSALGESRQADLEFSRNSSYSPGVGSSPQDASLKPPLAGAAT